MVLNLAGTCCACGSEKWKPEHSEFLHGADVVLVPDNDGPGWKHVNKVGAMLVGIAERIRVLRLPGLPDKGDIIDWARLEIGGTRERFDALLETAQDWQRPAATISEEEKTEAQKREDELIDALLKTPQGLEFHRKRAEVVKELKTTNTAINEELQARRDAVPLHGHWLVVPWDEHVEGDSLVRDIIRAFVVMRSAPTTFPLPLHYGQCLAGCTTRSPFTHRSFSLPAPKRNAGRRQS